MVVLFDRFRVYTNPNGKFVVVGDDEVALVNRYTGEVQKCKAKTFCNFIKGVFPDEEEQKELLYQIIK